MLLTVVHDPNALSPEEARLLRLLVYAHPGTLNGHYLRHRLNLPAPPTETAQRLVQRGFIEQVRSPQGDEPAEWRATRAGIRQEEHQAQLKR